MTAPNKFWALIPTAGRGSRMGSERPKQYLPLAGRTVLDHSLSLFINHSRIAGIVVALAADDPYWPELSASRSPRVKTVTGGAERPDSVLAGLVYLRTVAGAQDWVLVHDAARPCLTRQQLDTLVTRIEGDAVGGLLAMPARDTLKQARDGRAVATLDRNCIWQAQTPQMFRLGMLHDALAGALAAGKPVTDEAAAMEQAGHCPRLVESSADNIKITRPEDLPLAEFILQRRKS